MTEVMWFLNIGVLAVELIISLVISFSMILILIGPPLVAPRIYHTSLSVSLSKCYTTNRSIQIRVKGFRFQTLFIGPIAVLSKFS